MLNRDSTRPSRGLASMGVVALRAQTEGWQLACSAIGSCLSLWLCEHVSHQAAGGWEAGWARSSVYGGDRREGLTQ